MTKKSDNTSPLQKLLKSGSTQKAVREMSAVTDNSEAQEECFRSVNLYNVPKAWVEVIKRHGFTFVGFAKLAIKERIDRLEMK